MLPYSWGELVGVHVEGACLLVPVWTLSLVREVVATVGELVCPLFLMTLQSHISLLPLPILLISLSA